MSLRTRACKDLSIHRARVFLVDFLPDMPFVTNALCHRRAGPLEESEWQIDIQSEVVKLNLVLIAIWMSAAASSIAHIDEATVYWSDAGLECSKRLTGSPDSVNIEQMCGGCAPGYIPDHTTLGEPK
jgi:hypothetical protein